MTELRTQVGTQNYQAPEILGCGMFEEDDYTMAVDLWSLGCVIYKILTNSVPFSDIRALRRFCRSQSDFPVEPLTGVGVSVGGIDFVKSLTMADPKARATVDIARQSGWLNSSLEESMTDSTKAGMSSKFIGARVGQGSMNDDTQLSLRLAAAESRGSEHLMRFLVIISN